MLPGKMGVLFAGHVEWHQKVFADACAHLIDSGQKFSQKLMHADFKNFIDLLVTQSAQKAQRSMLRSMGVIISDSFESIDKLLETGDK